MAITTVFLDLYQTIAYYHPSRETRQAQVLKEFGFEVDHRTICWAYVQADHHFTIAGQERPIHLRSPEDQEQVYLRFQKMVLEKVGLGHAVPLAAEMRKSYSNIYREFRLFPDVQQAVDELTRAGYRLGLITNISDDPVEKLEAAGLRAPLAAVAASCVTGCEKPDGRIFQAALDAAGIRPEEAVHVGDQMLADVEGALSAGMKAVLLDRYDVQEGKHPHRITSLLDLVPLLRSEPFNE